MLQLATIALTAALPLLPADTDSPATQPARSTTTTPLLAGPDIDAGGAAPTLVVREFDGRLVPVTGLPALAALEKLELSAEQEKAIDATLSARMDVVDTLLREHRVEFQTFIQSLQASRGNREARRAMRSEFREWQQLIKPLTDRGRMRDEIAAHLDDAQRETFNTMLDNYEAARIEQRGKENGRQAKRRANDNRRRANRMGPDPDVLIEFRQSFERLVAQPQEEMDERFEQLNLPEDLKKKLRDTIQRIAMEGNGELSRQEIGRRAMREVLEDVPRSERREVMRELRKLRN